MPVTLDSLREWIDENEEDVIVDGPYNMSITQWDELGRRIRNQFYTEHHINIPIPRGDDMWYEIAWNTVHESDVDADDAMDIFLRVMADLINEYNIQTH